ncbi:MAG: hypothetical protein H6704_03745 [Myxococcales bacterium]|nr:hypothetical protein [Myxococcales bacterium]
MRRAWRWMVVAGLVVGGAGCDDGGGGEAVAQDAESGPGDAADVPDGGGPDGGGPDAARPDAGDPGGGCGASVGAEAAWTAPPGLAAPVDGETPPRDAACAADAWLTHLRGWIVDQDGRPIEGAKAQACVRRAPDEQLNCLSPADTGADGVFTIAVPEAGGNRCMRRLAVRTLAPGCGSATLYCRVDVPAPDAVDSVLRAPGPFTLVDTAPATELPPEGDPEATRTVVFADGLELDVTPGRLYAEGEGYVGLGAAAVAPDAQGLCFAADVADFSALYAFYPEGDVEGAPFPVRLPNTAGLPAGAAVEFLTLGGLDCTLDAEHRIEEGEWAVSGTGTVSADGSQVVSDAGSGVPCLTWFGYRPL